MRPRESKEPVLLSLLFSLSYRYDYLKCRFQNSQAFFKTRPVFIFQSFAIQSYKLLDIAMNHPVQDKTSQLIKPLQ